MCCLKSYLPSARLSRAISYSDCGSMNCAILSYGVQKSRGSERCPVSLEFVCVQSSTGEASSKSLIGLV